MKEGDIEGDRGGEVKSNIQTETEKEESIRDKDEV